MDTLQSFLQTYELFFQPFTNALEYLSMSLKSVELFYEHLLTDKEFNQRVRSAGSKGNCRRIAKAEGFDFT
jgi:Nif11 domain